MNEHRDGLQLSIPMPGGLVERIEQVPIDEVRETLGFRSSPNGCAKLALSATKDKAAAWVARAQESHLQHRDIWFLADRQMWMSVG